MSYIFSQALVEEYSPANCLGTDASVPSNANHTHKPCLWHDKTMEPSRLSRFGMTCAPFEANHGEELLMSFVAAFRAKTSAQPEAAQELTANDPDYGAKWPVSSVRYDHASSSWKTAHCLWEEVLPWCSVTLPKWGMTRSGAVYQHPTAERPISATVSGLWQTPVADDSVNREKGKWNSRGEPKLSAQVKHPEYWPTPRSCSAMAATLTDKGERFPNLETVMAGRHPETVGGQLNPTWVEWLMGWPLGWTDLKPLEMDKFHEWQRQHSQCFQGKNKEQAA